MRYGICVCVWHMRMRYDKRSSNSIFFMRGINAGNPEQARWAHLAPSGSQSEHRIRFLLPTGADGDVIIVLIVGSRQKLFQYSIDRYSDSFREFSVSPTC